MSILNNNIVAVAGGAGRLGSEFCKTIVQNGGKVLIGDIDIKKSHALVNHLGSNNAKSIALDIIDQESIQLFLNKGLNKFGKIDAAINCAYPSAGDFKLSFEDLTPSYLKESLFNQLGSAILFAQILLKYFSSQDGGNLINVSSIYGVSSPRFEDYKGTNISSKIEYGAAKSGIISITKFLAKYYRGKNIRVNSISPGGILDQQPEIFLKNYKANCNLKGMLDPKDISGALIFLLSDQSKYINGQNFIIDDGWSL